MNLHRTPWTLQQQRSAALRDVVAGLERRQATELPWTPELEHAFGDRDSLLVALHELWNRQLSARLDLALELNDIRGASVAEAWAAVDAQFPGLRRLLEAYADHPAVARQRALADRMVAMAAGLAWAGDPLPVAAARGAAFLARTRAQDVRLVPARRDGWLRERLSFRHVLASA